MSDLTDISRYIWPDADQGRQPQYPGPVSNLFGSPSVWLPSVGLQDLANVSPLTQTAYGTRGLGVKGATIKHTGTNGSAGFTVSTKSGATYECWLLVFGSAVGALNSVSYYEAGTSSTNCVYLNGSGQVVLRASSSNRCQTSAALGAGDALFIVGKQADYRLYLKGAKATAVGNYGNWTATNLLAAGSNSLALAARWTNEIPNDAQIRSLLSNPWQLIDTPQPIRLVPAAGGAGAQLQGAALSVAAGSGSLTTQIPLAGSAVALSTAGGSLTAQITLSGAALAQAVSSALLSTGIVMTAQAVAQAAAQGTLTTAIRLAAAAASQSSASGTLGGGVALAGNAQAQSTATGSLTAQIQLSAQAISQAAASATLAGGAAQLAALAQSVSSAGGVLTTSIRLSGQAVSQAIASGSLTIQTGLAALAQAVSSASGSLTTQIRMAGSAQSSASATASLSTTATNWAAGPIWMATRAERITTFAARALSATVMTPGVARATRYSTEVLHVH